MTTERSETLAELVRKADVLVEALPYMREFKGKSIVIKYGGSAMVDQALKDSFARDVALLQHIGVNPVVAHGGGPQIGEVLKKMNIPTRFVDGVRVTDARTLDIVEMVLVGKVNKEIVALVNSHGGKAAGLSGKDGALLLAEKMVMEKAGPPTDRPALNRPEIIDLGMVGKITRVDVSILKMLMDGGVIPVIAPVGYGANGETYNINADFVAAELASALGAEKLVLLTDEKGILDAQGELVSTLTEKDAGQLIEDQVITGGMTPKVKACFSALDSGVKKAHIIDGRITHSALLEIFTDKGVGTEILGSATN